MELVLKMENGNGNDPLNEAAAKAIALIDSAEVGPFAWLKRAVRWCLALNYPTPSRRAAAANAITNASTEGIRALDDWNLAGLRQAMAELEKVCRELAKPIPVETFAQHLAAIALRMNLSGWLSEEVDALALFAEGGAIGQDRVVEFDVNSAKLKAKGRTVSRLEIREALRPAWQPADEWHVTNQYQSLRAAHEQSVAREQRAKADSVIRYSAGPARLIGKPAAA
jgi:hypothetical protein